MNTRAQAVYQTLGDWAAAFLCASFVSFVVGNLQSLNIGTRHLPCLLLEF